MKARSPALAANLGSTIGGGQGQPGQNCESAFSFNRCAEPFYRKLDVLRLQFAPALDLSLIAVLREALSALRAKRI
jgi:hypothetical protein